MKLDFRKKHRGLLWAAEVVNGRNSSLSGSGAPVGTPPFNGAMYLDVATGTMWQGRNVLNFNNSRISLPTIANVRQVRLRFWHNDPAPTTLRAMFNGSTSVVRARREITTGNLNAVDGGSIVYDGASIASNTVNPSANAWHTYVQTNLSDGDLAWIGSLNTAAAYWSGRLADVQALNASGTLLASYAINEGSGTTIFDSSGNGNHGTLTLGSGSWELVWMPMDQNLIVGNGPPTGTPSVAGLDYLDLTNNVRYRSRNVLNFNGSRIDLPTITGVREVQIRFWHNEPSPSAFRTLHDGLSGDATSLLMLAERASTTGNLNFATGLTAVLDGASVSNNATNPSASVWHTLNTTSTTDRKLTRIGSNRTNGANYLGRIADVRALGVGGTLLASYSINEGSGTTIIDSVSGQNGTLTIGSGSWQLDWVPQN